MPSKPSSLSPEFAARFQHEGVVEAYQHRIEHFEGDEVGHERPEGDMPVGKDPAVSGEDEDVDKKDQIPAAKQSH